ncbi:cell division protein FtsB [Alginatibacterium sediminis]|uniref:Cell division protein FtsB n=1 Tax=Alginatibacterium sediminis TaxID=2164068 RepID=A0A420ED36_9ALTE|nr:cell division protein FtsB [Alginatibacterium sediminis]RKF18617.1 cell division protein FtsB [Alginatibacterium sediminis]
MITAILLVVLAGLQYHLWFGKNSIHDYSSMLQEVEHLQESNAQLGQRNTVIQADINDLRTGLDAIEEHARNELGMIREGETFYRIVSQP